MRAPLRVAAVLALVVLGVGCQPKKSNNTAELLLTERMAQVLLRDDRAAEAEKAFREVIRGDSKNAAAYDGLGVSLLMQARYKEALAPLDKAVSLEPGNASYRNNRGVARMEIGRYQEAEEDFDVAEKSVNPDDRVSATINRGRLREREGNYAAAEKEFTTALARDPKSFAALYGRAGVRESQGDLEGAAEDYLGAVKLDTRSAEANMRLGLCLVALKKPALGRRYLQRAVDLDPTGDAGAKARMVLESTKNPS